MSEEKQLNQVLGFWDLMAQAIGQIIGAGIMSLTGAAIALTGKSVPLAFILSTLFVMGQMLPYIFIGSTVKISGGPYGIIQVLLSPKLGGFYAIVYTMSQISIASYGLSASEYILGLFGAGLELRVVVALVFLTLFYILNLMGVDAFALVQKFVVGALIIALIIFTVFGLPKVDWANLTAEGQWMTAGFNGLISAAALLRFATGGAQVVVSMADEAKNPTTDIPIVIVTSTLGVAVLYALMSIVAAGVLPLDQTAGQSLVNTARTILPYPLFVVFILLGAEGALLSTLNSQLASATKPILQATWDGWFPEAWGKLNKKKVPFIYLTVLFIIGAATAVTGMDIATITTLVQIIGSVNNVLLVYAMMNLEKVFPEAWAASKFRVSRGLMIAMFIYGEAAVLYALWVQLQGKAAWVYIGNVVMVVVALGYSILRYNKGGIAKTPYRTILGETQK